VANSNPVVLNSEGYLDTLVYGNPASGYDYRVTLKTSADVEIWTEDDIVVDGADSAQITEGSFTGTLTGYASGPTGTVNYRIVNNSSGTGKIAHLYLSASITGTSNATGMTLTGAPAELKPSVSRFASCAVIDENINIVAMAFISSSNGVITFFQHVDDSGTGSGKVTLSSTAFLNSSTKGLDSSWTISYPL
jgi:hypothetical protein